MTSTLRWNDVSKWVDLATGAVVGPSTPPTEGFFLTVQTGGNDTRKSGSGVGSFDKNDLRNRIATALGRNLGGRIKFFDGGSGINSAISSKEVDCPDATEPQPCFCFKAYTTAQLNSRMSAITKPEVWVWWQEFYAGADQGSWDAYNAKYADMKATRDAHANGALVQLQQVSSVSDERTTPGYFARANGAVTDEWGADTYNAKQGSPYPSAVVFQAQYDAWQAMRAVNPNLKWVISEYGLPRMKSLAPDVLYTGAERLANLQMHVTWLIDHGCSGLTYWAVDNSNVSPIKDWSLDKNTPQDAAFAAGVAALMNAHPLPAGF